MHEYNDAIKTQRYLHFVPYLFPHFQCCVGLVEEVKNIDTKQSNKRNNQNSKTKDKTVTWNKEPQMTGQHEPLWKPEVKSGAPEG